jgi:hypothetical protein
MADEHLLGAQPDSGGNQHRPERFGEMQSASDLSLTLPLRESLLLGARVVNPNRRVPVTQRPGSPIQDRASPKRLLT